MVPQPVDRRRRPVDDDPQGFGVPRGDQLRRRAKERLGRDARDVKARPLCSW
jgi:hypothetical protein